jgi:hypothetical protein
MLSREVETEFRLLMHQHDKNSNWHMLPRWEREPLEKVWAEVLADDDVQAFIAKTLYIPWEQPASPHARFLIAVLDYLGGNTQNPRIHLNFYPDVRLTEATIVSMDLEDPTDGEMCVVKYTYMAHLELDGSTTVDCVYAGHGNHWHPGKHIPCKYVASQPWIHRIKELTPDP